MRVGIDVRAMQFPGGTRGTGRYILNILEGLVAIDDDTEYVLLHLREKPIPPELTKFGKRVKFAPLEGPPTLVTRYPWYQSAEWMRQMRVLPLLHWKSYFRNHANRFRQEVRKQALDVVHFPAPFDPNLAPVSGCPCKTVYTFLDGIPLVLASHFYDLWTIPLQRRYNMQKAAFQQASLVVAISECSRNDAMRLYGIAPERIQRVYCDMQTDLTPKVPQEIVEAIKGKFRIDRPYFAFCSTIDWHKGIDSLIPAMAKFKETAAVPHQLVIIGYQEEKCRFELYQLAFDNGLHGGDVVLTGLVDEMELHAFYQGAVALVSPSRYEGFGLPAAQALAIGTPVIASKRASLPEVVGDAGLLVDPEDVQEIANAMSRMANEPELRARCIALGFEQVRKFDSRERAQDIWKAYKKALESE